MQQPSFQNDALQEPNTKAPGGCGSSAPPADGWVCGCSCEGLGESQSALQALQKNRLINNNLSWEGDCVMLAACLQGIDEIIW